MDPEEMLNEVSKLDIEDCLQVALKKHTDDASHLIREQLRHGLNAKGERIRPRYRSRAYAQMKNSMNPLPGFGNPDLILTGDFKDAIDTTITKGDIKSDSSDIKKDLLVEKYSPSILDMSDKSGSTFADIITEDFQKQITKNSGLEFS